MLPKQLMVHDDCCRLRTHPRITALVVRLLGGILDALQKVAMSAKEAE